MASVIGVTFSLHYCGGTFKEICFTADTEKNCCGENEMEGCCMDKVVHAKCKDSHTPGGHVFVQKIVADETPLLPAYYGSRYCCPAIKLPDNNHELLGHPPPLINDKTPIYLRNRVIRV